MGEPVLRVPVRYHRIARLYGPGMPPSGREGFHTGIVQKLVNQVGSVSVHCWNLGDPSDPWE